MKYFSLIKKSPNTLFTLLLVGILIGIGGFNLLGDIILSLILVSFSFILGCLICLKYRQIFLCCIFIVLGSLIGIGVGYNNGQYVSHNLDTLDIYTGLYNIYQGEVVKVHKRSDYYDEYVMSLDIIGEYNLDQEVLYIVRLPKNFVLEPGQYIRHQGVMYTLEDFDGFSYKKYMLSQGIYFSTSSNNVDNISYKRDTLQYKMYVMREQLLSNIADIFPGQEAIFLGGILFGARENIPAELKEDFNNSGLTHFIAVSGFNITLCIIFISFIFAFLPVYLRSILVITSIILFSFFVGLGAPVVRAAIMGILGYIFLQSGNTSNTLTLIVFTAVLMCVFSPLSLNYDVSLHLSFLAVIGIVYTQELFTKVFSWVPSTFAVREAFVLTLSALSFSLPIMMFQFGQISLLAPLANIAVTWTIPLAMLGGALTLILDALSPYLGQVMGFFTWILLRYDIAMVELFGNIDGALLRVDFGVYSNYLQALYFMVLTYVIALYHFNKKKNQL